EAGLAFAPRLVEVVRGGEPREAASHDHEVEDLARVPRRRAKVASVAHLVGHAHDLGRVAVRGRVVADTAVAVPEVLASGALPLPAGGTRLQDERAPRARGDQHGVQEVAPGDVLVETEQPVVARGGTHRGLPRSSTGARRKPYAATRRESSGRQG